ncbi:MAG: heavy metal-binding domain-containing protein [Solirubrobacteraceae bacterium]
MGFFGREDEVDDRQAEYLARIEAGGIPTRAEERLRALTEPGVLFTSGLSVNEFALLNRMGPKPLAQVMGASVIRTGWQYLPALPPGVNVISNAWYGPTNTGVALQSPYTEASPAQVRSYKWHTTVVCELEVLSDAWNLARQRALDRLREEARQVGADAVVGVHLRHGDQDFGKRTIDYVVSGTAIRLPGSTPTERPTLTDVSVQDYWRLHNAGHELVDFVATTAVMFASPPRATRLRRLWTKAQNQELEELSSAFHEAREAVRTRLLGQVRDAHATGAVGVEFSHALNRDKLALTSSLLASATPGWHRGRFGMPYRVSGHSDVKRSGWMITMHAAGTAIRHGQARSRPPTKTTVRMRST